MDCTKLNLYTNHEHVNNYLLYLYLPTLHLGTRPTPPTHRPLCIMLRHLKASETSGEAFEPLLHLLEARY